MQMYQVGQSVPAFRRGDGLFLTVDGSGALLVCVMADPTAKERLAFKSGQPLRIRMGEYAGLLFWAVRFGDIPMMDCTYSPQVAPTKPVVALPAPGQGYNLTVILADGDTGEVLSVRTVGLGHDFSVSMRDIINRIGGQPINYQRSLSAIYSLSTEALAAKATEEWELRPESGQNEGKEARKSLRGISHMLRDIPYKKPLPVPLIHLHVYVADAGHCLMAVPAVFVSDAVREGCENYEVPLPVRYVLEKGWKPIAGTDAIAVSVPYDNTFGAEVPEGYEEYEG